MSFFGSLFGLFGKKSAAAPKPVNQNTNNSTASRPRNRQVYEGRPVDPPEWAKDVAPAEIIGLLNKHIACRYAPKFEIKRIMSTQMGPDGNLIPEYDGIAGDCGALKNFGLKVAKDSGLTMPYRYVDINTAYRACCDNPKRCPFFLAAEGESDAVNSRRR